MMMIMMIIIIIIIIQKFITPTLSRIKYESEALVKKCENTMHLIDRMLVFVSDTKFIKGAKIHHFDKMCDNFLQTSKILSYLPD